jgi:hypothetical protein
MAYACVNSISVSASGFREYLTTGGHGHFSGNRTHSELASDLLEIMAGKAENRIKRGLPPVENQCE